LQPRASRPLRRTRASCAPGRCPGPDVGARRVHAPPAAPPSALTTAGHSDAGWQARAPHALPDTTVPTPLARVTTLPPAHGVLDTARGGPSPARSPGPGPESDPRGSSYQSPARPRETPPGARPAAPARRPYADEPVPARVRRSGVYGVAWAG